MSLAGVPTEAASSAHLRDAMPGKVLNCYAHSSGRGKFLAVLQVKSGPLDSGRPRRLG